MHPPCYKRSPLSDPDDDLYDDSELFLNTSVTPATSAVPAVPAISKNRRGRPQTPAPKITTTTTTASEPSDLGVDDYLDSLPIAVGFDALVNYPASVGESEGIPLSTRVPAHWIQQIDTIRQMPGTKLPIIWPRRSDFVRWCVMLGMKQIHKLSEVVNNPDPLAQLQLDPVLRARIFIEGAGSEAASRADTMNEAREKMTAIAKASTFLLSIGELAEASDMVNMWIAGAVTQDSGFWKAFLTKLLIEDIDMKRVIAALHTNGMIDDAYMLSVITKNGVMDGYDPNDPLQDIPITVEKPKPVTKAKSPSANRRSRRPRVTTDEEGQPSYDEQPDE